MSRKIKTIQYLNFIFLIRMLSYQKHIGARFFPKLTIINRNGEKIPITFKEGDRLFDAIEDTPAAELQGQCGGNMACGGCHCILESSVYTKPEEDEAATLENSQGVTSTSRLACNLILTSKFDGTTIKMGPV